MTNDGILDLSKLDCQGVERKILKMPRDGTSHQPDYGIPSCRWEVAGSGSILFTVMAKKWPDPGLQELAMPDGTSFGKP